MATKASSRKRSTSWTTALALQSGGWWKTLGGVLVVVPTGAWLAQFVFGKIEAERRKNAAATFLQRTLRQPRFLSAGYSTLIVAPGSGDGKVRVTVASAGGAFKHGGHGKVASEEVKHQAEHWARAQPGVKEVQTC